MSDEQTTAVSPLDEEQTMPTKPVSSGVPDFLQSGEHAGEGLEQANQYVAMPLLKLIHPTSSQDLQDEFGVGSAVVNGRLLIAFGEKVPVSTLFFWPSWSKRRDNADQADNFIVEESFDPNSELAEKARNPELRSEVYPDNPKMFYTYAETLNYIVQTREESNDVPKGTVFAIKWALGGHRVATRFNSYMRGLNVPIYAHVIDLEVAKAKNAQNVWYQAEWSLSDVKEDRFCTQDELLPLRDGWLSLKEAHQQKNLGISDGDSGDD